MSSVQIQNHAAINVLQQLWTLFNWQTEECIRAPGKSELSQSNIWMPLPQQGLHLGLVQVFSHTKQESVLDLYVAVHHMSVIHFSCACSKHTAQMEIPRSQSQAAGSCHQPSASHQHETFFYMIKDPQHLLLQWNYLFSHTKFSFPSKSRAIVWVMPLFYQREIGCVFTKA